MPLTGTLLTLGLVAAASIAGATPVHAAGGIEVSADGVVFSDALPGALFQLTGPLIPGSIVGEDLWIRNGAATPGVLRIALTDVVTTDAVFADALTVSATLANASGTGSASAAPAIPLSATNPCAVLLEGSILHPGETARVRTALVLGDLDGQDGQAATASMSLRVALIDPAAPSPSATDCGPDGAEVPILADPDRPPRTVPPAAPSGSATGAQLSTGTGGASGTATDGGTTGGLPGIPLPLQAFVDPNTGELNERLVGVMGGSFIAGIGAFWLLAWRGRRTRDDQDVGESL
ncbi:MAG: hypothetical protein ABWX59_08910 [Microbacteriaceae bacterium]